MGELYEAQSQFKVLLANKLKILLTIAGSKNKLSSLIGVRYQTIISWFRGAIPGDDNLRKIDRFIKESQNGSQKQ